MAETIVNGKPYKKRLGDRKDGRLIRTLDAYHGLMPYIMVKKNDACNYFEDDFEVSNADKFLRAQRMENNMPGLGMLHLITAIYVRACSQYPAINRFIRGQRSFARFNPELVMSIKIEMKADSPETSIKVPFELSDTIGDIYNKINAAIDAARSGATATDDTAKLMMKFPRLLRKFIVAAMRFCDYFGWLPKSLIDASPFHGSVIITDLGSVGLPTLYHHLYNFGNLPIFITIGTKNTVNEINREGEVVKKKYLNMSFVVDERITDGFYASQAYRLFKDLIKNPEKLLVPPEKIVSDIL